MRSLWTDFGYIHFRLRLIVVTNLPTEIRERCSMEVNVLQSLGYLPVPGDGVAVYNGFQWTLREPYSPMTHP